MGRNRGNKMRSQVEGRATSSSRKTMISTRTRISFKLRKILSRMKSGTQGCVNGSTQVKAGASSMWQQARPKLPIVKVNQSLWGKVWEKKVLLVTLSWRRKCPVEISLFIKAQLARRDLGERIIYLRYHFYTPEETHNCLLN